MHLECLQAQIWDDDAQNMLLLVPLVLPPFIRLFKTDRRNARCLGKTSTLPIDFALYKQSKRLESTNGAAYQNDTLLSSLSCFSEGRNFPRLPTLRLPPELQGGGGGGSGEFSGAKILAPRIKGRASTGSQRSGLLPKCCWQESYVRFRRGCFAPRARFFAKCIAYRDEHSLTSVGGLFVLKREQRANSMQSHVPSSLSTGFATNFFITSLVYTCVGIKLYGGQWESWTLDVVCLGFKIHRS